MSRNPSARVSPRKDASIVVLASLNDAPNDVLSGARYRNVKTSSLPSRDLGRSALKSCSLP